MNRRQAIRAGLTGAAALVLARQGDAMQQTQTGRTQVRPVDNGAALENPGMGWVLHYYDNSLNNYGTRLAPSDPLDDYPGLTTIYLRLAWAYLEPREGEFDWSVVDTPAQRWIARGKRIAFRITCCETGEPYATPRWVEQAGAKGRRFTPGKALQPDGTHWEPVYDDPVFLEKLDRFLAAFAARYDSDPAVDFVDIGSLGVWGEGHTGWSSRENYSAEVQVRHIDLHRKHFKRALLVANDDFADHKRGMLGIDYACEHGLALRDDSILVEPGKRAYHHAAMAAPFWPTTPVILESEHYGSSRQKGNWGDGSLYLQAVEEYHASYASIHWWPREFLADNRDLVARINRRLGYRIQLREASWPEQVRAGEPLTFATRWRNGGVAPCLPGGCPAITLKDAQGGIAAVFVDEGFDVAALPVGEDNKAEERSRERSFTPRLKLPPGEYGVFVSVGTAAGKPVLALPLDGGDGGRRYRIGAITVTA